MAVGKPAIRNNGGRCWAIALWHISLKVALTDQGMFVAHNSSFFWNHAPRALVEFLQSDMRSSSIATSYLLARPVGRSCGGAVLRQTVISIVTPNGRFWGAVQFSE